jgi:hypothetical protein
VQNYVFLFKHLLFPFLLAYFSGAIPAIRCIHAKKMRGMPLLSGLKKIHLVKIEQDGFF